MTAVTVSNDMTGGIIDRFRSMDVAGAAVLAGHVAASMARNAVSTVLVFGVAFLIGFRPNAGPTDWLTAAGVLLHADMAPRGRRQPAGHPGHRDPPRPAPRPPVGASPWKAVAWCLGILVVSVALSGVLFHRRTA
jgi:ABC-2 type transport system permease protein